MLERLDRKSLDLLLRLQEALNRAQSGRRKRVKIHTKEKCPKCRKPFQETPLGLLCPKCFTVPRRFFIDLTWQGRRVKIYSDRRGQPLSSWEQAKRLQAHIAWEIENHVFDPSKYVAGDVERYLVKTLLEEYLAEKERELKHAAFRMKKTWLKLFEAHLGAEDVRDLRAEHLHRFFNEVREGRSQKTLKNILTEVKAFLNWCVKLQIIDRVPPIPEVKVPEPTIKWIDRETQMRLLEAIPEEHRDIFEFMFWCGCRPGEVRALAWDSVSFKERVVVFRRTFSDNTLEETTKEGKAKALPMTERIYEMLKKRYEERKHPFFVFYYLDQAGVARPYGEQKLRKIWQEACRKVGLKGITLYQAVRHSFAMQKLSQGFTLEEIGAVLGHSTSETTKKYARYQAERLRPLLEDNVIPFPSRKTDKKRS